MAGLFSAECDRPRPLQCPNGDALWPFQPACFTMLLRPRTGTLRPRRRAKGQRPTHGRVGAGLASPARTGAGADAILMTQRSRKLVLTLALTYNPLPQERKSRRHVFIFSADLPANPVICISKDAANDSPSPPTGVGGENPSPAGAGEGGRRPVEGRAEQNQICGRGEVARDTN